MSTASSKLKQGTTNVTFAHSFEHMQHDVKILTIMLLRLGILAGGCHSCAPETSSVALTSREYAIPQSLLLLPFLVMVAVTAAAAVWASHRQLSRTTLQYASHSRPLQRQHMLFECPLCFLLRCLCVVPFTCDGRATGRLVLAHTPRRARPLLLPMCPPKRSGHCCALPLAVEVIIVGECRISMPCGAALLLLPALNIWCHSRTCGCLSCTLRGPYVCFAPRDVVSVDGSAQCAHILPPRRLPCSIAGDGRA
jgi:hypothetical protein